MYERQLRIYSFKSVIGPPSTKLQHSSRKYSSCYVDREIYYYHDEGEVFINCGINPLGSEIRIELT